MSVDLAGKRLELLREVVPHLRPVRILLVAIAGLHKAYRCCDDQFAAARLLVAIRREIEDNFIPSFAAMHEEVTGSELSRAVPPASEARAAGDGRKPPDAVATKSWRVEAHPGRLSPTSKRRCSDTNCRRGMACRKLCALGLAAVVAGFRDAA
jgi:hypothetical protein